MGWYGGALDHHSLLETALRDRNWWDRLRAPWASVRAASAKIAKGPWKAGSLGTSDLIEFHRAEHVNTFRKQLLDVAQEVGVHWGTGWGETSIWSPPCTSVLLYPFPKGLP